MILACSFSNPHPSLPLKISEPIYKVGQSSARVDGRCIFNTSDAKNSSASVRVARLCACIRVLLVGFDFDIFSLAELTAIFVPVEGGARVARRFTFQRQLFTFQNPLRIHGLYLRS